MRANSDVTEALRRTIGLMQGELERSVLSTQMLGTFPPKVCCLELNLSTDSSSATLRSTSSTYDTLDNVLMMSKQLITALEKADRMDRALIIAGLVFFFLVVLFILKQRVIDRGLRIALFWTRFIPRGSNDLTNKMERGDFTTTVTSLASTITTVVTVAQGELTSSVTSLVSSLSRSVVLLAVVNLLKHSIVEPRHPTIRPRLPRLLMKPFRVSLSKPTMNYDS
jgi:protein transport protein SEC20